MPHLLIGWPSIRQRLRDAQQVLLTLDYDGTLSPIVDQPEQAILPTETKKSLTRLSNMEKYIVGVISARSLEDVRARVGIDWLIYAGNHGLEINGRGMVFIHPEAVQQKESVNQAFLQLQQGLDHLTGVTVEHKGLSLTVHYRLSPDNLVRQVKETVHAIADPFLTSGTLVLSSGKMAIEIRPQVTWGKGEAIQEIQRAFPQASMPVYFGDDLPDEDAFTAVQAVGGFGVFVGPTGAATSALYRVNSPQEVDESLRLMAQI